MASSADQRGSLQRDAREKLLDQFLRGNSRALARAITLVENEVPGYRDLLSDLYHRAGRAKKIGITGSTGAGKSTLVYELAKLLLKRGQTVGIIAVDPSSPFTGGALLGDRIRMQDIGVQKDVYIRSMATRGSLGGLAKATRETSIVLDAFGKDVILIESVGVGQVTLDIADVVDTTVVVLVPESGDSIQAMKAGLMEIADIFVINKADREGADRLQNELEAILELQRSDDGWDYPVVKTQARQGQGLEALLGHIDRQEQYLEKRKKDLLQAEILQLLSETVREKIHRRLVQEGRLETVMSEILSGRLDPYQAVDGLLKRIEGAGSDG